MANGRLDESPCAAHRSQYVLRLLRHQQSRGQMVMMGNPDREKDNSAIVAKVNQYLIRCHLLLEIQKPDYELALHNADLALELAQMCGLWRLEGKVQRLRGHCFRGLGRWKQAYNSYVRGASVADAADNIEVWTKECLDMMERRGEKRRPRRRKPVLSVQVPRLDEDKEKERRRETSGYQQVQYDEEGEDDEVQDMAYAATPRLRRVQRFVIEPRLVGS